VLFLADGELPAQAPASDTVGGSTAGAPPQEPGSISTTPILPELDRLQSAASDTNAQISRLRIEKWKADPNSRQQAQSNAQSIQRNLTSALPAMITGVRSAPQDLGADFRLYRNLNALFDVMSSLTESAGAFGSKAEYQALARELDTFDSVRRNLGDYLEQLAASTQTQLEQLRTQVRSLQAAAAAAPPKKSVVDDTVPAKKTSTTRKAKPKKPVSPDSGSASTQDSGATNPPH
jgi:BMFP domain-containing protein YqiC